mgnify:CR=1 FL=1
MKQSNTNRTIPDLLGDLADPVRVRLLRLLTREELAVGEIAKVVQMPQSTVSRHLKVLADGGWLAKRTEGTASLFVARALELAPALRAIWETVESHLPRSPELQEDDRRLPAVLAERRLDSQTYFGRLAGAWDDVRTSLFGTAFTPYALLALVNPEWTVADLGCGTGNGSECLAPYVRRVIAVDSSLPMLDAARKRLASCPNVEFRAGNLEALPLPDRSVDAAVCMLVLHHLEEPVAALREMARVLRPARGPSAPLGGVALVVDMVPHPREEYAKTMGHKHLGFSTDQIRSMFKEAGLTEPRVMDLAGDPEGKGPGLFVATATRREP